MTLTSPGAAIRALAVLALAPLVGGIGFASAGTAPDTNQLQDIPVFKDQLYGNWSGGDVVAPNGQLPVDTAETYGGLPSLRFEVVGPSGWWWQAILAGQDWLSYSVEHHRSGGYLEFNIKCEAGGERFKFGLVDVDNVRTPHESERWFDSSTWVTVSTSWQHVRIPLADLIPDSAVAPSGNFNPRQMQSVRLQEAYASPYAKTFWINDLKFTSPEREPSAPAIRLNEVGDLSAAEKYAYVADFPEALIADAGTRFEVHGADDGAVAPRLYRPALRDAMRYFFYQRQGIAIEEPYAEGFARASATRAT